MRKLILLLLLSIPVFGQTFNGGTIGGNILPDQTGRNLGNSTYRWNGFFQNLDFSGTLTLNGIAYINPYSTYASAYGLSDCGANINAADTALTAAYGANVGEIIVDKGCGQTINTVVTINGHGVRFLAGAGTFTSTISSASFGLFKLKSNSSIICDDWSTIIKESGTNGTRQTIIQGYNQATDGKTPDLNLLVKGCHFQGANPNLSGTPAAIEFGNCHQCRVEHVWIDATSGEGVSVGGDPSTGNHAQDVWVIDNLFTQNATQTVAVVNGKNVTIRGNHFIVPGQGVTIGSSIDIEPNTTSDLSENITIDGNVFDFRGSTSGGYALTLTESPSTNGPFTISNNTVYGGILNGDTGGPTRPMITAFAIGANNPATVRDVSITGNNVVMMNGSAITLHDTTRAYIANNKVTCAGGGNGYIRLTTNTTNSVVIGNAVSDPCSGGATTTKIQEDSTGVSGNYFADNIASSMVLVGTGSVAASYVDSVTGFLTTPDPNGSTRIFGYTTENITLSTVGTTTDSSANLLPANSLIDAVSCRVTTAITTATDWSVGDASTAARFDAANATMTLGTTSNSTGTAWTTGIASATTGIKQTAAAKLRITTTGTPGAGVIRCTVFYRQSTPPTS